MQREHIVDGWWQLPGKPQGGVAGHQERPRSQDLALGASAGADRGAPKRSAKTSGKFMKKIVTGLGIERATPHDHRAGCRGRQSLRAVAAAVSAADPNVIAVSATDAEDRLFKASNRGRHVAIAAPGVDILVPIPGANYDLTSGTSIAAAHVSGVVALILERKPTLDPDAVRRVLLSTARDLGTPAATTSSAPASPTLTRRCWRSSRVPSRGGDVPAEPMARRRSDRVDAGRDFRAAVECRGPWPRLGDRCGPRRCRHRRQRNRRERAAGLCGWLSQLPLGRAVRPLGQLPRQHQGVPLLLLIAPKPAIGAYAPPFPRADLLDPPGPPPGGSPFLRLESSTHGACDDHHTNAVCAEPVETFLSGHATNDQQSHSGPQDKRETSMNTKTKFFAALTASAILCFATDPAAAQYNIFDTRSGTFTDVYVNGQPMRLGYVRQFEERCQTRIAAGQWWVEPTDTNVYHPQTSMTHQVSMVQDL